jgi:hypothetical protein
MDKSKLVAALTLAVAAAAARADAQVADVSVGIGGVTFDASYETWATSVHSPALDARANVRLGNRFSVEPFITYGHRTIPVSEYRYQPLMVGGDTHRTEGLYGVVLHQRLGGQTHSGFQAYLTYGMNGTYYKEAAPERQYIYGPRTVTTVPAQTSSQTDAMIFPSVGFGIREPLGDHLALRADADMVFFIIPAGVRASVGLVIPFGRIQ